MIYWSHGAQLTDVNYDNSRYPIIQVLQYTCMGVSWISKVGVTEIHSTDEHNIISSSGKFINVCAYPDIIVIRSGAFWTLFQNCLYPQILWYRCLAQCLVHISILITNACFSILIHSEHWFILYTWISLLFNYYSLLSLASSISSPPLKMIPMYTCIIIGK